MRQILLVALLGYAWTADWGYTGDHGVDHWTSISATCGGHRQSPINIPHVETTQMNYSSDLDSFVFSGYDSVPTAGFQIENNGHTVVISMKNSSLNAVPVNISGGGLTGTYVAEQFHFHWGENDTKGSEHLFRNRQYPLELHVVHYKESYGNLSESLAHDDGVAVLGFFFVTIQDDNEKMEPIIAALENIKYKGKEKNISLNINDVISGKTDEYYRYNGSLTTPPCSEAVIWTVFENKNFISPAQLDKFRHLFSSVENTDEERRLEFNYRPIQKLYNRAVHKNYDEDIPKSFHWSYHGHQGPKYWQDYYSTCKGLRQSPIDIPLVSDKTKVMYDNRMHLDTLEFHNYDMPVTGTIKNNGHTIVVNVETDMYIEHGGLSGRYKAAQFHYHWGHDNRHGSEHTQEGNAYPLELHIVHYKEEYGGVTASSSKDDGLAVLGFWFTVDSDLNSGYSSFISKLLDVQFKDIQKSISGFTMEELTFANLKKSPNGTHRPYFRYMGGLTTPPCSQVVTWSIMKDPIGIHADQLAEFHKIARVTEREAHNPTNDHDLVKENYRPTQPLNSRHVFTSYDMTDRTAGAASVYQRFITVVVLIFIGVLFK